MAITKVRIKINGVWNNLVKNSGTGKWEGNITAPAATSYHQAGGYYAVTIEATNSAGTVVTKEATDATIGQALRLVVKETIKPVITLIQPSNGAYVSNNKIPVVFRVTDETGGSGVNTASVRLKIGNATYTETSAGMERTAITNGYQYTYTPQAALSDERKDIIINAKDNDGNTAAEVAASFVVDTTPPTLSISYPQNGLETNKKDIVLQGITNDALSSPVKVTVEHNAQSYRPGTGTDGEFSQALVLTEGTNAIRVTSTDAAGKATIINISVLLDTTVPQVTAVTMTPNPADASASVQITLEVR